MDDLRAPITLEARGPLTAGLIAVMAVARGLDFLSTRLVTPELQLEANPLRRPHSRRREFILKRHP